MTHLTREQILARKIGKGTVTLEDGETVAVRGVSHAQVVEGQERFEKGNDRVAWLLHCALVDPEMTYEECLLWTEQDGPGDIDRIMDEVRAMSRMGEGAGKSGVRRPRKRSRS